METNWVAPGGFPGWTASVQIGGGPVGREAQLERLRRCVRQDPGAPGALVLLGEQGIGKSRLLRAAGEYASGAGCLVLSVQGWTFEQERPFGCLSHLLAPLKDRISSLAEPHRTVLQSLLGPASGAEAPTGADVWAAATALLDRLGLPDPDGSSGRTLITVDDAHACDRSTLELLASLVRRTEGNRPSVLLASRDSELLLGLPADIEALHVAPLSCRESAELLDRLPYPPSGRSRLEMVDQAQGNPSALLELWRLRAPATDRALAGERAPRLLHVGNRFEALLNALPTSARRALTYAALALPGDDAAAVMAALGTSDLGVWTPAEEAGIVALVDGRIVFRHPLARVAARAAQPAVALQQAHRDLAQAASARPLDRARHRAAATLGQDPATADALRLAARHAPDEVTAARALEEAARLSVTAGERARLLAGALTAAAAVGDQGWVLDLHTRLVSVNTDPRLGVAAALAAAAALSQTSRQKEAFDLLLDTAEQVPPGDAPAAAQVAAVAAAIAHQSGLAEHRVRLSQLPSWSVEAGPALAGFVRAVAAVPGIARRAVRRLETPRPAGLPEARAQLADRAAAASVAYLSDEPDVCLGQFRAVDAQLRSRRAFGLRAWYTAPLLDTLLATGHWSEAAALLQEALDTAALLRLSRLQADLEAHALSLHALRGAVPTTVPARPSAPLDLCENAATHVRMVRAGALVAMADEEWADAFRRLRTLFAEDGSPLHPFLSPRAIAELALTGHRAGFGEEAARILGQVRSAQGERPTTRMALQLHHATALVAPDTDPEHHFHLALVNAEGKHWPMERAQARLSYAIWLRRARRPSESRQQLVAALETAEALGAEPLAAAVRQELRACGVATSSPDSGAALAELTAQQQRIVRMAADGLSNREIGERLYLSPRTVGTHLYNVYPKLGVSRRHQLRDLLQDR